MDVAIGQVWQDRDPRMVGRQLTIVRLDSKYAYATTWPNSNWGRGATKRTARIMLSRLAKKFRLIAASANGGKGVPGSAETPKGGQGDGSPE